MPPPLPSLSGDAKKLIRRRKAGTSIADTKKAIEDVAKARLLKKQEKKSLQSKKTESSSLPKRGLFTKVQEWWTVVPDIVVSHKKKLSSLLAKDSDEYTAFHSNAQTLFLTQVRDFGPSSKSEGGQSRDQKWLRTVMKGGTLTDRVAAMTLTIQANPAYAILSIKKLTAMAEKKNQREAGLAIDALKDLYVSNLLPPHRRLKYLYEQPLAHGTITDAHRIGFFFEHELKTCFASLLEVLRKASNDNLDFFKAKSMNAAFTLICDRPEGEAHLLALLVNKLGDPSRKIAGKATHFLQQLVLLHPAMRFTVTREVEQTLFRSNLSDKARYYSILFLNQTTFSHEDKELAQHLIGLYFRLFKKYVTDKNSSLATRLLSALLTGVNRAFPYAGMNASDFEEHLDMLFKLAHVSSIQTAVQALSFVFELIDPKKNGKKSNSKTKVNAIDHRPVDSSSVSAETPSKFSKLENRFYRALYSLCLSPAVTTGKPKLFLNLVFRALKSDSNETRVRAVVKRLLQRASSGNAQLAAGCLYLLSAVIAAKPEIRNMIRENQLKSDEDEMYDPKNRDPRFSNSDKTSLWEIALYKTHFHPSVVSFATQLISEGKVRYAGDPLLDFSLMKFLDRYSFKQPKTRKIRKGDSERQPSHTQAQREMALRAPVNSEKFLHSKNVRADEVFFQTYFMKKRELEGDSKKKKKKLSNEGDLQADLNAADNAEEEAFVESLALGLMKDDIDHADEDEVFDLGTFSSDDDEQGDEIDTTAFDDLDDMGEDDFDNFDDEEGDRENEGRKTAKQRLGLYAAAEEFSDILNAEVTSGEKKEGKHFDSLEEKGRSNSRNKRKRGKSKKRRGKRRKR
eukprot:g1892.t1